MQKPVPNYPPPTSLNPLKDAVSVSAVDYSAEFDGLYKRLNNKKNSFGEKNKHLESR